MWVSAAVKWGMGGGLFDHRDGDSSALALRWCKFGDAVEVLLFVLSLG